MRKITIWIACLCPLFLLGQQRSYTAENANLRSKFADAANQLSLVVSLDKKVYLPGEDIQVQATFVNPGKIHLKVINPLIIGVGSYQLLSEGSDVQESFQGAIYPNMEMRPFGPNEVITFAPGESKSISFDSSNSDAAAIAPSKSGSYLIQFRNGSAGFEVHNGILDSFVEVLVPATRIQRKLTNRNESSRPLAQKAFTLKNADGYRLCVQVKPMYSTAENRRFQSMRRSSGDAESLRDYLGPFRCLETSPTRISEIDLSFGSDGTMLVIGKREGASMLSFRLDEANKRIP